MPDYVKSLSVTGRAPRRMARCDVAHISCVSQSTDAGYRVRHDRCQHGPFPVTMKVISNDDHDDHAAPPHDCPLADRP